MIVDLIPIVITPIPLKKIEGGRGMLESACLWSVGQSVRLQNLVH